MNQAEKDAVRALLIAQLGEQPHRNHRRRAAAFLRSLADELQPGVGHGYGAQPGCGIRWTGRDIVIGKVLWDAAGQPRHVHFEFVGSTTRIVPDMDGDYTITVGRSRHIGCIRVWHIGQWAKGWRPGRIERGAICFDIEATAP